MANGAVPSPSVYSTVPSEIWRNIFASASETVEPMDDHSVAIDPLIFRFHMCCPTTVESTQYRLMFVSKYFNALATEFFLQRFTICGTKQLTLLYKCLREPSNLASNFARWTRRFDFKYHVIGVRNRKRTHLDTLPFVLRTCRDLTHLIIELPSTVLMDGETILNACLESCRVLEVLHWGVQCPIPVHKFISAFHNIRILRLTDDYSFIPPFSSSPSQSQSVEFPFLHTIEGRDFDFSFPFNDVSLPSLSTVHIRNDNYFDVHAWSQSRIHEFAQVHGERITTLTMVGVIGKHHGPEAVPFLRQLTTLQELIVDVTDLLHLQSYEYLIHPHLVRLGLTNQRQGIPWDTRDDFRAALLARLKAYFPALRVLRWFGDLHIPWDAKDQDGLEGTEGIRIESGTGEQLKLSWLSMRSGNSVNDGNIEYIANLFDPHPSDGVLAQN